MTEASQTADERARNQFGSIFRALQSVTQKSVAASLGLSETTVSHHVNDQLERSVQIIVRAGYKVVPEDHICTRPDELRFLRWAYAQTVAQAPWILNGTEHEE